MSEEDGKTEGDQLSDEKTMAAITDILDSALRHFEIYSGTPCTLEGIRNDHEFLHEIEGRLDMAQLLREATVEDHLQITSLIINAIVSCGKECPTVEQRNCFILQKLKTEIEIQGSTSGMLLLLEKLGALNEEKIQIHDIGGDRGLLVGIISCIRKRLQQTRGIIIDLDPFAKLGFDATKSSPCGKTSLAQFIPGNFATTRIKNNPNSKNYWIAKAPSEDLLQLLLERIAEIRGSQIPDGIIILPCKCHCYEQYQYPCGQNGGIITQDEWERIIKITKMREKHPILHDIATKVTARSRRLADCIRAHEINTSNPEVKAEVYTLWSPTPSEAGRNGILIRKVA